MCVNNFLFALSEVIRSLHKSEMKSKLQLEEQIIALTNKIQTDYPELSKYIPELPGNNSESQVVNRENLEDYYNSLEEIITKYSKTHDHL